MAFLSWQSCQVLEELPTLCRIVHANKHALQTAMNDAHPELKQIFSSYN